MEQIKYPCMLFEECKSCVWCWDDACHNPVPTPCSKGDVDEMPSQYTSSEAAEAWQPRLRECAPPAPRILDSGARREFTTGAVRDVGEGKGRCDLLPFEVLASMDSLHPELWDALVEFFNYRSCRGLLEYLRTFLVNAFDDLPNGLLELAKHYEEGAAKYEARNWEKGIPLSRYVDSAVRHYLKYRRGDEDEPHDRAMAWNLCGLLWTYRHHPELDDLPLYCPPLDDEEAEP